MLQVYKQSFGSWNDDALFSENREYPAVHVGLTNDQGIKKIINISLVLFCLSCGQVWAKSSEVISGDFGHIPFSFQAVISKGVQHQEQGIGNGVELFSSVAPLGKPMADGGTQTESANRPNEGNQRGIGVEQQNKLSPEDSHKFRRLLLIQFVVFAAVFPVGAYFSLRASLRREWRKHTPKGRPLKVPVLGMISILCITRRIKPRRWQIWEQRQWFRDMRVCHGLVGAYRDMRHWKKSVVGIW